MISINNFNPVTKIKTVLLLNSNYIENYANQKVLENYGVTNVITFRNAYSALSYLIDTPYKYQLILVDIHLPILDGFEFIDKFNQLELYKKHGEICLLSASLNPFQKKKAAEKNIKFIEKPLIIENLLPY
jgi:CheY-like chemotaxis protein